jgi:hypothetical protein
MLSGSASSIFPDASSALRLTKNPMESGRIDSSFECKSRISSFSKPPMEDGKLYNRMRQIASSSNRKEKRIQPTES